MFRMEFQSDAGGGIGGDMTESVYERYRDGESSAPVVFEGRVGRFGAVRRVPTPASSGTGSWTEADLMHFDAPSLQGVAHDEGTNHAIFLDAQVLRALAGPFEVDAASTSSGSVSMRSTSGSECSSSSSSSEGSIAEMRALQRVTKPWEAPLLALQRQAEEERIVSERTQRELRDLANCVNDVSRTRNAPKRKKLRRVLSKTGITTVFRFLRNSLSLFKSPKIYNASERVSPVVMPRSASFPSDIAAADVALSLLRSAPRQVTSQIQFETVRSTQRDVDAWTMEEYMARNARSHHREHEELGGIEGNNLVNQYWNDDVGVAYDSDSD